MRRLLKSLFVFASFLLTAISYAQISSDSVATVEEQEDGMLLRMDTGALKLEVRGPAIIHVVYSRDGMIPQHENPMIVPPTWPPAPWKLDSSDQDITVRTAQLSVVVARKDGHLTFKDQQNHTLLREGGDHGGKTMTPATVNGEKTYHAAELFFPDSDEALLRTRPAPGRPWNYSDESEELKQENTNISIPFFVSSLGHVMLWNNASVSRFNDRFPQRLYISSEVADIIDYFFVYGPEFDQVIAEYRDLTAKPSCLASGHTASGNPRTRTGPRKEFWEQRTNSGSWGSPLTTSSRTGSGGRNWGLTSSATSILIRTVWLTPFIANISTWGRRKR